ncbi:MAG: 5-methyltetrahydropteroyltriglutamate--homocysteine methyltransferase [Brockia lithotrophica]|uniref:5-methyltetrahydropteroyltriglutamate--homocysteine methyltransferase n=1 Tax=Brockia lithotrophica TaxID=933949 RepID=A0A2T5GAP0_9BACL|nr:MAG: 5-methyltetrahydropteroyltriglutamate--homocysteine methyltransferase [Brockia lithotrophica]
MPLVTANLGYPRLGYRRELKRALEGYWEGKITRETLLAELEALERAHLTLQKDKGLTYVPVGDFSAYDHVLDHAALFGLLPKRFGYRGGPVDLDLYFAVARGTKEAPAAAMVKWFNTNYHYIVPEWEEGVTPELTGEGPVERVRRARAWGIENVRPVLLGPYTFVRLAKGPGVEDVRRAVMALVPLYGEILRRLEAEGVSWVQIDEPALVQDVPEEHLPLLEEAYAALVGALSSLRILLQTYFEAVDHYERIVRLPVHGIGLDFVHGRARNEAALATHGFPADKVLGVGLVNGRNVWRTPLGERAEWLKGLTRYVSPERLILQPSTSLLFVPHTVKLEKKLSPELIQVLAFAEEKLDELALLAYALDPTPEVREAYREADEALRRFAAAHPFPATQGEEHVGPRKTPFPERWRIQQERFRLPLFPTTMIGSLPQTEEVRAARARWKRGEWSTETYETFIREEIARWIRIQEDLGIDVLVHGEFERSDMVEFFAEKMGGFAFLERGWVQSYGSRAVRPPIIYGPAAYLEPITVSWTAYAQSLTDRPVKGILTGPVTILQWSYAREDVPRETVARSIAWAMREEVLALERAGIGIIQIDEPAFREALPLKHADWADYLRWAVETFHILSNGVQDQTQIQSHMCYSRFDDILDAIKDLDADVILIETARSHGELIAAFEEGGYPNAIGLGVWDIHSPRIPPVEEMVALVERALRVLPKELFWVNPDCGLKTRKEEEVLASLRNMLEAARILRQRYGG